MEVEKIVGVQDKKVQGAAKHVRREDEMAMKSPFGPRSGSSSAWADTFRLLGADVRSLHV
jgi:hypothetical protein